MKKLLTFGALFSALLAFSTGISSLWGGSTIPVALAYTSALNPQDPATAPANYVVNIPDAKFKQRLNEIIAAKTGSPRTPTQNITAGELRDSSMKNFTNQFTFNEKGITNLEGAQFLTQAEILHFGNRSLSVADRNIIGNLAPLQDLQNLTELRLPYNNLSDLTPLQNITTLKTLDITANSSISNIDVIASLINLEALFMSHLPNTKTIAPVQWLPRLKNLQFSNNGVTDLSPIQGKTSLEYLYANTNLINNFEVLSSLVNLKHLEISNTRITDITVLAPLTQLQHLSLWFNDQIADFSTLAGFPGLKYLNIQKTNFKDSDLVHITPTNLPVLTDLRARENQLSDISSLGGFSLVAASTFNSQKKTIDITTQVIPNPIKNRNGSIVPVVETADITNVDASGNPSQNGGYLKIDKTGI